jgi:hypothetical protein
MTLIWLEVGGYGRIRGSPGKGSVESQTFDRGLRLEQRCHGTREALIANVLTRLVEFGCHDLLQH